MVDTGRPDYRTYLHPLSRDMPVIERDDGAG
jgi:hypothetical protein